MTASETTLASVPSRLTYGSVLSNIISFFDWLVLISAPVKGLKLDWTTPESCSRTSRQVSDGWYVALLSPSVELTSWALSAAGGFGWFREGIIIVLRSVWTSTVSSWLDVSSTANKHCYVDMHSTPTNCQHHAQRQQYCPACSKFLLPGPWHRRLCNSNDNQLHTSFDYINILSPLTIFKPIKIHDYLIYYRTFGH